jgi:hypothetical protein
MTGFASRRRAAILALSAVSLAGCVAPEAGRGSAAESGQPQIANYVCYDGARITIENNRSFVRVIESETDPVDLPASPPSQRIRYGQDGRALVFEGREALYMVSGRTPLTCRR